MPKIHLNECHLGIGYTKEDVLYVIGELNKEWEDFEFVYGGGPALHNFMSDEALDELLYDIEDLLFWRKTA